MKNMDVAVHDTTVAAEKGTFEGGLYSGTLKNDGVAIAPFHKYENQVPKKVQDAVKDLRQKIIDGDLKTMPDS
jgi:basic membrane protein A